MTSKLTIRTNRVPRDLLYWFDLSQREQASFDYLDTDEKQAEAQFFRYKGHTYDLGEFMACSKDSPMPGWDGYASDSFYSGVLIRFVEDHERVVCATYFS